MPRARVVGTQVFVDSATRVSRVTVADTRMDLLVAEVKEEHPRSPLVVGLVLPAGINEILPYAADAYFRAAGMSVLMDQVSVTTIQQPHFLAIIRIGNPPDCVEP